MQLICETMKEFAYGTSGDALGRLTSAIRHNWDGPSNNRVDRKVTETYDYDNAGRLKNITTEVAKNGSVVKTITSSSGQLLGYDSLDELQSITYPTCSSCGAPNIGTL